MIHSSHAQEWQHSAVDSQIIELNVCSLHDNLPYEYLLYSDQISRRNDGRLRDNWLNRYRHIEHGGWWCSGVDVLTGSDDLWGCFKPNKPRRAHDDRKLIKYEHPPRTETGIFALRVSLHIWQNIAQRYGQKVSYLNPDDFWQWVIEHPEIPITITEGAKKAGALLSAGYCAIALPGVNGGVRVPKDGLGNKIGKPHLIPQLLKLARQGRPIYLAFDQDTNPETAKRVRGAILQTAVCLESQGCNVKIINWRPELGKGVDDLIVAHGTEAFDAAFQAALSLDTWKALGYSHLSYTPNIQVNRRYLGDIQLPNFAKLIALKSAKGTGKTETISQWVGDAISKGQWVLVLTHRIQLGQALCERFGVPYITEVKDSSTGKTLGYGLCIDSLHPNSMAKFDAKNWEDGLVILDEAEQVLWHMLNSSTCSKERVPILKSFKTLIQNALSGEGRVVLSDADLTNVSIDYVRSLAGVDVEPFVIVNNFHPQQPWKVHRYGGTNPSQLVAGLVGHISSGGRPFVCLSGQKAKSKWSTSTLYAYLSQEFPDKKILRIDSESIADPKHAAFGCIAHLNQLLLEYDIVLASPSIETGVSIDLVGHFTSVWGINHGVTPVPSFLQSLARLREAVPRFIWTAKRGLGGIGNGSSSVTNLLGSQHKLSKANISLLQQADASFTELDGDDVFQSESLMTWAKMAARINATMNSYDAAVEAAIRAEGHTLMEAGVDDDASSAVKEAISETRDKNYEAHREAIAVSSDINKEQYEALSTSRVSSSLERRQVRKYDLHQRYGVEVTSDLVLMDDQGWYPQLRLHYFLTLGRQYLSMRDRSAADFQLKMGLGDVFVPDFNSSQLGLKIRAFDLLGITALLAQDGRELRNSDEDIQAIAAKAKSNPYQIKTVLDVGIAQSDSPIMVVKRLLAKLGVNVEFFKKEGARGSQQRVYRLVLPQDNRIEVFHVWRERDQEKADVIAAKTVATSNTVVRQTNNKYINTCLTTNGVTKDQ